MTSDLHMCLMMDPKKSEFPQESHNGKRKSLLSVRWCACFLFVLFSVTVREKKLIYRPKWSHLCSVPHNPNKTVRKHVDLIGLSFLKTRNSSLSHCEEKIPEKVVAVGSEGGDQIIRTRSNGALTVMPVLVCATTSTQCPVCFNL